MLIKDLLEVLKTDCVVVVDAENNILVDCETPYIKQACNDYMEREIDSIVPLNNEIEINLK